MISRENVLELQTRREIYQFILENPSLHLRELSRRIKIPKTTLKHHLRYLEKQNLIAINSEAGYKRYYVANKIGRKEKEILDLLRQEVPRHILMYMASYIVASQIELSKELMRHPSTINFHLKKLMKIGIIKHATIEKGKVLTGGIAYIKRNKRRSEIIYILRDAEIFYAIYNLLIICENNSPDQKIISDFLETKKETLLKRKPMSYRVLNNPESAIDSILETFYEIFPPPYHI